MSTKFWKYSNTNDTSNYGIEKLLNDVSQDPEDFDNRPNAAEQDEIMNKSLEETEDDNDIRILNELLDHNEILRELMASNTKLIDFLKSFKVLNKLVEFVILDFEEYNKLKERQSKFKINNIKESSENEKTLINENEKNTINEKSSLDNDTTFGLEIESGSSILDSDKFFQQVTTNDDDDDDEDNNDSLENMIDSPEEIYLHRAQVAAEILAANIWSITDSLINYPRLLIKLWSILDHENPLSLLKSSFFAKINEHLLDMKIDELVAYIVTFEQNLVERFFKHINDPQLMDLLLKLISTDNVNNSNGIIVFLKKKNFIPKLVEFLNPKYDTSIQTSAGDFLKAVITISGNPASGQDMNGSVDNSLIGSNELTRQLVSKKIVKKLVKYMLSGGSSLSNGVGIVVEIIRKNNSDYDLYQVSYITIESHPPNLRDPIYLGYLVKIFARNVRKFKKMLLYGSKINPLSNFETKKVETSFGKIAEPLGFDRFKICELVAELLHCSNMGLLNEPLGEKIVEERDKERLKVLETEYEAIEEIRQTFLEDLNSSKDETLSAYVEGSLPSNFQISKNIWSIKKKVDDTNGFVYDDEKEPEEEEHDHNQIVNTINRLSINDENKDSAHIKSIRSEFNENKRAKINDSLISGVIESDFEDSKNESMIKEDECAVEDEDDDDFFLETGNDIPTDDESELYNEEEENSFYEVSFNKEIIDENSLTERLKAKEFRYYFGELISNDAYKNEFSSVKRHYYDAEEKKIRDSFLIGDQLKISLQDSNIITIIVDFFFRFPWNNFFHNVAYDIIQQILNGAIEVGFNKYLIINLFLKNKGFVLEKILQGYKFGVKFQEVNNGIKLGYMGHLTLISEEIVKFLSFSNLRSLFWEPLEGQDVDIDTEYEFVNDGDEWNEYVNNTLAEIRSQFSSVLGGKSLTDDYEIVNDSSLINEEEVDDDDDEDADSLRGNVDSEHDDNYISDLVEDEEDENSNKKGEFFENREESHDEDDDDENYKWHYLDQSEYSSTDGPSTIHPLDVTAHLENSKQDDEDEENEEDYIPSHNDESNKGLFSYASIISHTSSGLHSELDDLDDELDVEDDDDEENDDDDEDDEDDEDEDETVGLTRSRSKDANWNDENEQERLITIANYIHGSIEH